VLLDGTFDFRHIFVGAFLLYEIQNALILKCLKYSAAAKTAAKAQRAIKKTCFPLGTTE
jgi:hypothetical protein